MDAKKELLLKSAARLYSLGVDLEGAKEHIRQLVSDGVDYNAPKMLQAVAEYTELNQQWEQLEQEYLQLRNEITTGIEE